MLVTRISLIGPLAEALLLIDRFARILMIFKPMIEFGSRSRVAYDKEYIFSIKFYANIAKPNLLVFVEAIWIVASKI